MSKSKQVPAVEKMINIMQLFANSPSVYLGITDIARALDYPKSTVHAILNTLLEYDFMIKSHFNEEYALGPAMTFVSDAYFRHIEIADAFNKVVETRIIPFKASLSCAILKREKLNVVSLIPPHEMCINIHIPKGTTISPLHSSAGKLLLSRFSDREIEKAYKLQVDTSTLQFVDSISSLHKEINQIRETGYSFSENEFDLGICGISCALNNKEKQVEAAISMYMSREEFNRSDIALYCNAIAEIIASMLDYLSLDAKNRKYFIG